jgi:glycosyltransferase involved in cell wall biosynthesis
MRIVLLGPLRSSFVQTDIAELGRTHTIIPLDTVLGKGLAGLRTLIVLTLKTLVALVRADALYCWFADYHTLVPTIAARLMGKRVYVVAGGYDVGYLPEINYGARMRAVRWFCTSRTFRYASKVFPVSEYALRQLAMLTEGRHAPATVIYNGVLPEKFPAGIDTDRLPLAITVSQGDSVTEYLRKGLDRFIRIAALVPEMTFKIIGPTGPALERAYRDAEGVGNVEVVPGFVSLHDVIIPNFMEASCYCQFSYEETFGMAVVESMLCGCIPVTTNGGALPEVTGPTGHRSDIDAELAAAIRTTHMATHSQREAARVYAGQFRAAHRGERLRSAL